MPVIFARRPPEADFLAKLTTLSPKSGWVQVNLAQDADCRKAVAEAQSRWGRVYGLVNNAGTQ